MKCLGEDKSLCSSLRGDGCEAAKRVGCFLITFEPEIAMLDLCSLDLMAHDQSIKHLLNRHTHTHTISILSLPPLPQNPRSRKET